MKKNEQGFALVLSLVLMLAMSLMGGALIVISAGDHRSNNKSDEYQQTFYVAEHALVEAEKYIINEMIGPWVDPQSNRIVAPGAGASNAELDAHAEYLNTIQTQATAKSPAGDGRVKGKGGCRLRRHTQCTARSGPEKEM